MAGISNTGWIMFIFDIVLPVAVALTYYSQSRPKAKPNRWAGIRIRVVASSPEVWRAAHREAFRWKRVNLVCFCGAAVICLLTLRSWHLVLAESILYCGYLIPFGFNVRHACTVARRMVDSQSRREDGARPMMVAEGGFAGCGGVRVGASRRVRGADGWRPDRTGCSWSGLRDRVMQELTGMRR